MKSRTSQKEVRHFIGVANYYRNIRARRSHMLALLTKLTPGKVNFGLRPNIMLSIKLSALWLDIFNNLSVF